MVTADRIVLSGVPSSEEVTATIRQECDTVLLAFSCGKDSIAAWLALRAAGFKRIIPMYRYLVPDLGFVERSLAYYERFFDTPISRVPHPAVFRMLRNLVFQPPERCAVIEAAKLPAVDYRAQNRLVCRRAGVDEDTWVASGVRCADSVQRRTHFLRHGASTHKQRTFYPVWDWRKHYLLAELRRVGCKLPVDYPMFGRSFDGIDWRFLDPIRTYFPEDYERILEWFPLARLEILRKDMHA